MITTVSISLVSPLPLIAVEFLEDEVVKRHPGFAGRMNRVLENRTDLVTDTSYMECGLLMKGIPTVYWLFPLSNV